MAEDISPEDIDDALVVAVDRTVEAQGHVDEVIDAGIVPPVPVADDVVRRAEDVQVLAHEAAGDMSAPETSSE
jgi:hypothetical protein